jgi:spore maturation protein CgeB
MASYDLYLSFTGGPLLSELERKFGVPRARPLYCSVDQELYFKESRDRRWDLGYLGTYSSDRQPVIDTLLCSTARAWRAGRFIVAGAQYPDTIQWPGNVEHIEHLSPAEHRAFYNSQRYTLNVTRQAMVAAGYSPSVRLFEAAACGTPIISDYWQGIEEFFEPGEEILLARSTDDVLACMKNYPEEQRARLGEKARLRVLKEHTAAHRAVTLEHYLLEALKHGNDSYASGITGARLQNSSTGDRGAWSMVSQSPSPGGH